MTDTPSPKHVFMSYSRRDEAVMRRITKFLRKQGINVWVDNENLVPGTPIWEVEIEKAIRGAGAVIVLLSPDSNESIWVRREIGFAERYHKRIFPVLIAGDEDSSITLRLITSQYVDIRENEEFGLNSLKTALLFFLEELEAREQERKAAEKTEQERIEREQLEREEKARKEKESAEKAAREEAEREAKEKAAQEKARQSTQRTIDRKPSEIDDDVKIITEEETESDIQEPEPTDEEPLGFFSGCVGLLMWIPYYVYIIFFCIVSCLVFSVLIEGDVKIVKYSPDGKILYVLRSDKFELYESSALTLNDSFSYPNTTFTSLAISPDAHYIATGTSNGSILFWEIPKSQTLVGHKKTVQSVDFSSDGDLLISGSDDETIRLWRVIDGKLQRTLEGDLGKIRNVVFSPDGKMLASISDDNLIRLWRVSDGFNFLTLEGHEEMVYSVAFSPDGEFLASGSMDKTIRLWRTSDGSQLPLIEPDSGYVLCVAFSPDGKILASGYGDNTIRLWNVNNRKQLRILKGHRGDISSIAFSPDGEMLASGSSDDTVRLWRVSDGEMLVKTTWKYGNPFK